MTIRKMILKDNQTTRGRICDASKFQSALIPVSSFVPDNNPKNSSMEIVVICGNFSCSDLACSDLACSDLGHSELTCSVLGHSDLAHSDLACSDLACSDLACSDLAHSDLDRFFVTFLTFFTQYSQLGNSFSTHPNKKK